MGFGIYSLLEATVLCLNAICILNEDRFLRHLSCWGGNSVRGFGEEPGIKSQLIHLMKSIRTVMKYPLIPVNVCIIIFKLLFG